MFCTDDRYADEEKEKRQSGMFCEDHDEIDGWKNYAGVVCQPVPRKQVVELLAESLCRLGPPEQRSNLEGPVLGCMNATP